MFKGVAVFDLEGDGLTPTKMHVFSVTTDGQNIKSTPGSRWDPHSLESLVYVGHNIARFDIPTLERLYGFSWKHRWVDTLILSWYLFPERNEHGLASWGESFGVPKPEVEDWEGLSYEEYEHRCQEDVKINWKLAELCANRLALLYVCDPSEAFDLPIVHYLMFKLDCAREQEQSKWRLDKPKCEAGIEELAEEVGRRTEALKQVMPKVAKMSKRMRPKKPFKKDGSYSAIGEGWFALLKERGLPEDYEGVVEVLHHYEEPNPGSSSQVKDWLFSLGWEPITFKYEKEDDGSMRMIPQVRVDGEEGKELCPSVKALIATESGIKELEGLTVAQHRLGLLRGFLRDADEDGFLSAQINGITNTLRFKHKTIVNLPGVNKPYGELVRGCLIAREGYELCGSDLSGLENRISDHFVHSLDPVYVVEKNKPGFDPHIQTAVVSGLMTEAEGEFYKWYKKENK